MKKVLLLAVSASMISAALANLETPSPSCCWAPRRPAHRAGGHIPSGAARRTLFASAETAPLAERIAHIRPRVLNVIKFVQEKTFAFDPQTTSVADAREILISMFPSEDILKLVLKARRVRSQLLMDNIPLDASNQIALVDDWAQIRLVD